MELLHIHYHGKKRQHKYLLLLYLGQRPDKICGIVTDIISDKEKEAILKNKKILKGWPLDKCIEWLKTHAKGAYDKGYREIYNYNTTILKRYEL